MMRIIDADLYAAEMKARQDACKELMDSAKEDDNWELYAHMSAKFSIFAEAKLTLDAMPTVDAVPVRCGQCKHGSKCLLGVVQCKMYGYKHQADWFCADGERRTDEQ